MDDDNKRAAAARELIARFRKGVLCTNSARKPGYPYGSVAPYALDPEGRPVFFLSSLALHTKNLMADPRASLLVMEEETPEADPLALARVTVFGRVTVVSKEEDGPLRTLYVAAYPAAREWMGFEDFKMFRMDIDEVYYIGGFGEMGWVAADDFRNAVQ